MLVAIADTHAVIWYIFDDKRLSAVASWVGRVCYPPFCGR